MVFSTKKSKSVTISRAFNLWLSGGSEISLRFLDLSSGDKTFFCVELSTPLLVKTEFKAQNVEIEPEKDPHLLPFFESADIFLAVMIFCGV